jgi:hypothetical protein
LTVAEKTSATALEIASVDGARYVHASTACDRIRQARSRHHHAAGRNRAKAEIKFQGRALNLSPPPATSVAGSTQNHYSPSMKIALLALIGLFVGAFGGAALGIGAGLVWIEVFKTTSFEGYSGMLVFFTFLPIGAAIGGLAGALLFGVTAARDAEMAARQSPTAPFDGRIGH